MAQDMLSITNDETIIFEPTTLISPHTNKPYNDGAPLKNDRDRVSFWCEVCTKQVGGVLNVFTHLKGKSHTNKEKSHQEIEEGCVEGSKITKIGEKRRQKEVTPSPIKKPKEDEKLSPSTVISPYTNKPFAEGDIALETEKQKTFWCNVCKKATKGILSTYQHLTGKAHAKSQVESKKGESQNVESKKRETKSKSTVNEESHTCEDCDLTFPSAVAAITHFKGKKHMKMIAAKARPKPKVREGQRNGFALSNNLKSIPNDNVGSQYQSNQYYSGVSSDQTFGRQRWDQEERRSNEYGWSY